MREIANSVSFEDVVIEFKHVESHVQDDKSLVGKICVSSPQDEIDTLTTLSVRGTNKKTVRIYFRWGNSVSFFALLYVPRTRVLFVGGGQASFSFSLVQERIINETYNDCAFWAFERIGDHILELGELTCYLYNIEGREIDKCPVDPPYEYKLQREGIRFKSPVYGTTWLRY